MFISIAILLFAMELGFRNPSVSGLKISHLPENIFPCTGSRVINSYERNVSCAETRFSSWASESQGNSTPAIRPWVLVTTPWPVGHKRTGTSCMVSHTWHSNEPTLGRNDSAPGCLHLAMAYRYYFFAWRKHENMFLCTGSRVINSCERICFMCWNPV